MSTHASSKKAFVPSVVRQPPGVASTRSASGTRTVSPDAFLPDNVEGATDLGGGLFLIEVRQVHRSRAKRAGLEGEQGLPPVSLRGLRAAFDKVSALRKGEEIDTAQKDPAAIPAANQALIAQLEQQESTTWRDLEGEGQLLRSSDFCKRLQVSRQALCKAVQEYRIFALDGPGGHQLYPAFFTDPAARRRELESVSKALGAIPGPSKWYFFTRPNLTLKGRTPLEAIAQGDIDAALRAAVGHRERLVGR